MNSIPKTTPQPHPEDFEKMTFTASDGTIYIALVRYSKRKV